MFRGRLLEGNEIKNKKYINRQHRDWIFRDAVGCETGENSNPGKREISRDSLQYPLEGCKYLETDSFLAKKQEKNL